jgi:hypothetical protein
MQLLTIGDMIKEYIPFKYPDKKVLVVYLNSADNATKFVRDIRHDFDPFEFVFQDIMIVTIPTWQEDWLKMIWKKYYANNPYMQIWFNGELKEENT